MRKYGTFYLIAVILVFLTSVHAQEISIMTYNIHHGANASGKPTLDSLGKFLRASQVDVIGLQEVDSVCNRSGQVDQPAILGAISGLDHYFTRHFAYQGGAYGQGLLSALPVSGIRNFRLPVYPLEEGKDVSVLLADILVEENKQFTIGVLHLDYRSAESRMHQIEILIASLADIRNLVLIGDFNARPDSPEMKRLGTEFEWLTASHDPSFPAVNPNRRIDFVMVRKDCEIRILSEAIVDVPFSDHLPVISTLRFE